MRTVQQVREMHMAPASRDLHRRQTLLTKTYNMTLCKISCTRGSDPQVDESHELQAILVDHDIPRCISPNMNSTLSD